MHLRFIFKNFVLLIRNTSILCWNMLSK